MELSDLGLDSQLVPHPAQLRCGDDADVYAEVGKDVPGAKMVSLSGTFMSKVFEGPYREIGHWVEAMKTWLQSEGKHFDKLYFYYTTCPKCAKKYGKNYVVLLAQIDK